MSHQTAKARHVERFLAMIRPIMRNELVLQRASAPATEADLPIAQDLLDTLEAHRHSCVGMAANTG